VFLDFYVAALYIVTWVLRYAAHT